MIKVRYVGLRKSWASKYQVWDYHVRTITISPYALRRADKAMLVAGYCRLPAVKK